MRLRAGFTRRWRPRLEPLEHRLLLNAADVLAEGVAPRVVVTATIHPGVGSPRDESSAPVVATLGSGASGDVPDDNDNDASERSVSEATGARTDGGLGLGPSTLILASVTASSGASAADLARISDASVQAAGAGIHAGSSTGMLVVPESVLGVALSGSGLAGRPLGLETGPPQTRRFEDPGRGLGGARRGYPVNPPGAALGSPYEPIPQPRGAGLITRLAPFDRASFERGFQRIFDKLRDLRAAPPGRPDTLLIGPLLLLQGIAAVALEVARRRLVPRVTTHLSVLVPFWGRFPKFYGSGRRSVDWMTELP
jgi:hypothetical protein